MKKRLRMRWGVSLFQDLKPKAGPAAFARTINVTRHVFVSSAVRKHARISIAEFCAAQLAHNFTLDVTFNFTTFY
jgi:hypothetical protein